MLTFTYTARDTKTGDKITAEIEAENEKSAARLLTEKGLVPLDIQVKEDDENLLSHFRDRVKTKQKVIFSRQLSTMINAGLPLIQSLNTVKG